MTRPPHMITLELDHIEREISEHEAAIEALKRRAAVLEGYSERDARADAAYEKVRSERGERG